MKVGAHPLVVAVALGLLGPAALAEESEEELEAAARCDTCDGSCAAACAPAAPAPVADPLSVQVAEVWDAMVLAEPLDA